MSRFLALLLIFFITNSDDLWARELVSDATIANQKQNTFEFELSNKIPVIYRRIEGNDIFEIVTAFAYGEAQLPKSKQGALNLTLSLMSRGSKTWPKAKLFALMEKYATGISCGMSIETSACSMAILQENAAELLAAYADVILHPELDPAEAQLMRQQIEASIKSSAQNPETFVNELVNGIFYGPEHPYWMASEQELAFLKQININNLAAAHREFLDQSRKVIVVVAGMPIVELKQLLEKSFSSLKQGNSSIAMPSLPIYSTKKNFAFSARDIPTAYLRAKFRLPGVTDPDAPAAGLMMRILSEELENEIRTKRSLSYAVYAQPIAHTLGIGVIHASTSHPQETLAAIVPVIKKIRNEKLSAVALERYKTVFATGYFLSIEDHSSLANGIASSQLYFGSNDKLYQTPRDLEKVTAEDIQRIARKFLKEFRLAIVYKAKDFNQKWSDNFFRELD